MANYNERAKQVSIETAGFNDTLKTGVRNGYEFGYVEAVEKGIKWIQENLGAQAAVEFKKYMNE